MNAVTPEKVQELYNKLENKQLFISNFGTKRFYTVDAEYLNKMYNYLIKKVKQ